MLVLDTSPLYRTVVSVGTKVGMVRVVGSKLTVNRQNLCL
jgi:hypothetical protein